MKWALVTGIILIAGLSPAKAVPSNDDRFLSQVVTSKPYKAVKRKAVHRRTVHARRGHVRGHRARSHVVSAARHLVDVRPGDFPSVQAASATVSRIGTAILGGRPAGCPHRYCGCGASLDLFGRIIPALNLAANWLRFPRAAPAPNMAAARRGHVFVLKQHVGGNRWLVYDANSGRGLTRLHVRSISGYVVVNPRGAYN